MLANIILISAPQNHMVSLLKKWVNVPVHLLTHSAYADNNWEDGKVISNEFTMLYAGKLYPEGSGLQMLLELIRKLPHAPLYKPFACHFFVDDTDALRKLAINFGVINNISINGWITPSKLWKNLRNAHLLIIADPGLTESFPLLPAKTYQYAHPGRQILSLSPHNNTDMHDFLEQHDAGKEYTDINEAENWIVQLSSERNLYESLQPLRKVAMRTDVAVEFGLEIEKILTHR